MSALSSVSSAKLFSFGSDLLGKRKRNQEKEEIEAAGAKKQKLHVEDSARVTLHFDWEQSTSLDDETFQKAISSISDLGELCWSHGYNEVTAQGINELKGKVFGLTRLELSKAGKVTEIALAELIREAQALRWINFSGCDRINEVFAQAFLNPHPYLETVELGYCSNMTDRAVELIATECPRLRTLDIEGCEKCTDEALILLSQRTAVLEKLFIGCCPSISDRGIEAIAKTATNLKEFSLRLNCQLTNASILAIGSHLSQLEKLDLSGCAEITDDAFLSLRNNNLSSLKELNISEAAITSCTLNQLTLMDLAESLQALSLSRCSKIDWSTLRFLENFPNLKRLDISYINLSVPFGLEPLQKCFKLESLNLNGVTYTDFRTLEAGRIISILEKMPQLREVNAEGATEQENFSKANLGTMLYYR